MSTGLIGEPNAAFLFYVYDLALKAFGPQAKRIHDTQTATTNFENIMSQLVIVLDIGGGTTGILLFCSLLFKTHIILFDCIRYHYHEDTQVL